MRNGKALLVGIICIGAALWLALGTTNQDDATRPELAQAFATQLHSSPPPLPTNTPTRIATITPIANWTKLVSTDAEIWLPRNFALMENDPRVAVKRYFSRAPVVGVVALYAYNPALGPSSLPNLQIYRVETKINPRRAPFGIDSGDTISEKPARVSLGRYIALRSVADKTLPSGSHFKQLLYWIPQSGTYWLLLFTTHAENFSSDLPAFENAARSFTILQ